MEGKCCIVELYISLALAKCFRMLSFAVLFGIPFFLAYSPFGPSDLFFYVVLWGVISINLHH